MDCNVDIGRSSPADQFSDWRAKSESKWNKCFYGDSSGATFSSKGGIVAGVSNGLNARQLGSAGMNVLEGRSRSVFSNGIIYLAEYILPSGRTISFLLQRSAGMTDVPLQSLSRATSSWSTISRCLPVFPSAFLFGVCPFRSFFPSLSRSSLGATFPGGSPLEHPSQPDLPIRYLIGSRYRTAVCSSGDENCSLTLNKRYRPATNYGRLKKEPPLPRGLKSGFVLRFYSAEGFADRGPTEDLQ